MTSTPFRRVRLAAAAVATTFVLAIVTAAGSQVYSVISSNLIPSMSQTPAASHIEPSERPSPSALASAASTDASAAAAVASPLQTTEVRIFQPFTYEGLRPFYRITRVDKGDCMVSRVSQDPAALHCFGENDDGAGNIYDPCWVSLDDMEFDPVVACIEDPWTTEVTQFTMSGPPEQEANDTPFPWGLELAVTGRTSAPVRCVAVFGHRAVVDEKPLNYTCTSGDEPAGTVIGEPEKPKAGPWLVWYSPATTSDTTLTPVRTVWK